jgi:hypothetical protein
LAAAIDALTVERLQRVPGADLDLDRDAWVEVVFGASTPEAFAGARWPTARAAAAATALRLLDAQRWRLAMFASDGWYWDDPIRPETRQVLRAAARAARIVDDAVGSTLERRLVADLAGFTSPSRGLDGAAIYRLALSDIGQPAPAT